MVTYHCADIQMIWYPCSCSLSTSKFSIFPHCFLLQTLITHRKLKHITMYLCNALLFCISKFLNFIYICSSTCLIFLMMTFWIPWNCNVYILLNHNELHNVILESRVISPSSSILKLLLRFVYTIRSMRLSPCIWTFELKRYPVIYSDTHLTIASVKNSVLEFHCLCIFPCNTYLSSISEDDHHMLEPRKKDLSNHFIVNTMLCLHKNLSTSILW